MNEKISVTVRSNFLRVNRRELWADVLDQPIDVNREPVDAARLELILKLGRITILEGIERFYEKHASGLGAKRPSIWTAHLGSLEQTEGRNSQVFTQAGYDNGGIIGSIDEIQDKFHGHWQAVEAAGFLPEVRRTFGKEDGGAWLLLRD
jgi:hypothetical protein